MRVEFGPVCQLRVSTTSTGLTHAVHLGRPALVHAHMTAAKAAVAAARVGLRLPVVTRHFAVLRGSTPLVRFGARFIRASLARQIPISRFVAGPIGEPSTVLLNGVSVPHRTIAPDFGAPNGAATRTREAD
jgi:hypothetical protein